MKKIDWFKEISKFILFLVITVGLFILAKFVFEDTHYSSALFGASGGIGGLLIFQLFRLFNFAKNPVKFEKEQIDVESINQFYTRRLDAPPVAVFLCL